MVLYFKTDKLPILNQRNTVKYYYCLFATDTRPQLWPSCNCLRSFMQVLTVHQGQMDPLDQDWKALMENLVLLDRKVLSETSLWIFEINIYVCVRISTWLERCSLVLLYFIHKHAATTHKRLFFGNRLLQ